MRARHRHFNPRDAGANLVYDSRRVTGLSDNDPVDTWPDISRNAYDATQTSTARPLYRTANQGGNPALRFDGVNDWMEIPVGPAVSTTAGHEVQVVIKQISFVSAPVYPTIVDFKSNVTQNWYVFYSNENAYKWICFGGQNTWTRLRWDNAANTNCNIINVNYNGSGAGTDANFKLFFNGTDRTLGASGAFAGNSSTGSMAVEALGLGYPTWNNADYYQIALINSASSDSLRKRLNHHAAFSFKISCN
jgi:hypothetical protein